MNRIPPLLFSAVLLTFASLPVSTHAAAANRAGPVPPLDAVAPGGLNTGTFPGITEAQMFYYQQAFNLEYQLADVTVTNARAELTAASWKMPRDDAAVAAALAKVAAADAADAKARADSFAKVQASPNRINRAQVAALLAAGVHYTGGAGLAGNNASATLPADFNDHEGYISLFDGVSLKGWDGNPKSWRVENGAIVGESTPQNPSGNTYIMYRDVEAHDFTLKMEIKAEGGAGTGIQYRSKTNLPWFAGVGANIVNNNGPTNLDWMATGPQADFWPNQRYTGQTYSENTPMRIEVTRGFIGEGAGYLPRRIMGTVGDPAALQALVKQNDWNEYTVIARGPVLIHIVNGAVMAVMIDDDPKSSNNWSGQIGVELEQTGRISFRNVWLKKIN